MKLSLKGDQISRRSRADDLVPVSLLIAILTTLAFGGGSSRVNVASLMVLRPILMIAIVILLFCRVRTPRIVGARVPLVLLGLFAIVMLVQLIPLPPFLWQALPGHEAYATVAILAGHSQPWHTISLVPILTVNSLLALLPSLAAFMVVRRLGVERYDTIITCMIAVATISCIFGVIQIATGDQSAAYLYSYAKTGNAPGLLANRNHQAAFLAGMLPMMTAWALRPSRNRQALVRRRSIAGLLAIVFLIVIVMTGSRSGLGLTIIGGLGSVWLVLRRRKRHGSSQGRWLLAGTIAVCIGAIILLPLAAGRDTVFSRLMNSDEDASTSLRVDALPITVDLAKRYAPFGSGLGTFDPVFRIVEPDRLLAPGYFNNAHNDLIELAITAGLPGLLLLIGLIAWIIFKFRQASSPLVSDGSSIIMQGGVMFASILLLASLSDYPLRTPLLAGMFALALAIVAHSGREYQSNT